jgi:hypothetical protein
MHDQPSHQFLFIAALLLEVGSARRRQSLRGSVSWPSVRRAGHGCDFFGGLERSNFGSSFDTCHEQ